MPHREQTVLQISRIEGLRLLYRLSVATAVASAVFSVVFGLVLIKNFGGFDTDGPVFEREQPQRQVRHDPYNSLPTDDPQMVALKEQAAADRANVPLREEIRSLDQELRITFWDRRATARFASYLMLTASVVFLISTRAATTINRRLPQPREGKPVAGESRLITESIYAVLAVAVVLVQIAGVLALSGRSVFEEMLAAKQAETALENSSTVESPTTGTALSEPLHAAPGAESLHAVPPESRWAVFRGSNGSGLSDAVVPTTWNIESGENVAWKCDVSLAGNSSPIVWGNRLFLTGADKSSRKIFCIDSETGKLLWETEAPSTPESARPLPEKEDTGFASPTPATDGTRVYALFANGDLCAVDFEGKSLWSVSLGAPDSLYGFSASPTVFNGNVIVQYDVGDGTDGKSHVSAYGGADGHVVWTAARAIPNSWSSPVVAEVAGRPQLLTCGDPFVIAYDPNDGKELWRCKCLSADVGPSPIAFDKYVFAANQSPRSTCIDASGSGDVSTTNIAWSGNGALPDTTSPLAVRTGDRWDVYTLATTGYLVCYDPSNIRNNRAVYWELELGEGMANFYSSPAFFGGKIYCFDKSEDAPTAYVIDPAKVPKGPDGAVATGQIEPEAAKEMIVATNPLPEPIVSSPAVADGKLFFRGPKTVYCIATRAE